MKKTIVALAAAATIAVATLSPNPADARGRGWIVPGILGGVVAGIIIGNALNNHPGYYTYDDYDVAAPPGCYWARRAWRDEYGNVHYSKPRYFCD
jgi:hypothetical protein